MPSPVPTPVAAAIGLVPTVLDGVRKLPARAAGKAVALPVHAVSHVLTNIDNAKHGYDALAERGERLLARLRGTSFDEVEDAVEDALQGTALARPYDAVEDALEDAGERVTSIAKGAASRARTATARATGTAARTADTAGEKVEQAADALAPTAERVATDAAQAPAEAKKAAKKAGKKAVAGAEKAAAKAGGAAERTADLADDLATEIAKGDEVPEAEQPKGEATPSAPSGEVERHDTAASDQVVASVEQVSAKVGGEVVSHDELPLPDYDHLTLGSLRGRMRSLDLPQLVQVRDYEKAHADRLPVVTMLDNRIAKLAADPTAPLSGGSPTAPVPEKAPAPGGSTVDASTAGPVQGTAPHGVPGNSQAPR